MNEDQRKWLMYLQKKGVRFEYCNMNNEWVNDGKCTFSASQKKYRIPAQSIPDIPDWRELCREMQSKGVRFKMLWGSTWSEGHYEFENERDRYQILQQPIPEWSNEEMTAETKPDPRDEIPHHELQIQWHEDKLHSLRTREQMREWEYRLVVGDGEWKICNDPHFSEKYEYRRKPKEITYYHCVISRLDKTTGLTLTRVVTGFSRDDLESYVRGEKIKVQSTKLDPIIETTVEIED